MNKRLLSLLIALMMVLSTVSISMAATGNDKVDWLIEKGLVTGYPDGTYGLERNITRAEVAAMVTRTLEQENVAATLQAISSRFTDMNLSNVLWARGYVNFVDGQGIVNGYPDGTFGPSRNITYAEIIKILVMVNGDIPDTTGYEGALWAVPYITKAVSVGITEGVTIPNDNYNGIATREKVFEMIYNTMIKKVVVEQEIYKGIVIENSRVAGLDSDEISFIVFQPGDNPPGANLRYKKDSQVKITLPANQDAETLLGKVVDVTIDKDNNAVKLTVDNSYTYYNGPIIASEDEITLKDGTKYDVYLEDRFTNSIDKIYAVYHNDKDYEYDDYVSALNRSNRTDDGRFVAEFVKATLKGGKTFFIDSFTFDDIAPVKEVKRNGDEVYVYDDTIAAGITEYNLDEIFAFTSQGFKSIALKDIKAKDVVHVYDDDRAIVRQDAVDEGEFDAVRVSSGYYYVEIDGERYQIRDTNFKRPVYSLDGSKFFTLLAVNSSTALNDLRNEDVSFLLDLNNHVQLISGDLEFSEKLVLLDNVGNRDISAIDASGAKTTYRTDNFSRFLFANSTAPRALGDFSRGDIAYLFNEGNLIDTLVRMDTASNIDTNAVKVAKTTRGAFDINLNNAWIRLESGVFEYTDTTNVFIVELEGSAITRLEATTMKKIVDSANPDSNLRAHIITERDFNNMNVGNEIRYGNATNVAHTIIFTDYVLDDQLLNDVTIQLEFNYNSGDDEIIGSDFDGKEVEYVVAGFANIPDLDAGDIVTLYLDDSDLVVDADVRITGSNRAYEVVDVYERSGRIQSITLDDDGEDVEYLVSRDLLIFGADDVRDRDDILFAVNEDDEIIVILVE
ncbi:S-layer homology domain-containing protein [Tissierella creatinini]|nr:S-layer homology domain-containing protein [Tissierella creatinini]TJX63549.1 S-layer homology domain-containing protein [Soehngenia saccharolytica]